MICAADVCHVYTHILINRSTCGLRAGVVTGRGVFSDPYILEINLSAGLLYQQPDCGVKQSADSTVNLVVIKQKTCESNSTNDQRYVSNCKITLPPSNYTSINGQASYYCVFPSNIKFLYQQSSLDLTPPADIYAIGKRGTCAKSVGSGSGQGVDGSPFEMKIDVTNTLIDCGVMNTESGVYTVLIYIQQYPTVLTKFDSTYLLICNFSASSTITLQSQVITVVRYSHIPTQIISQRNTTASLSVVSGTGSVGLSSFVVGDQIRLVAQLLDSRKFHCGVKVTNNKPTTQFVTNTKPTTEFVANTKSTTQFVANTKPTTQFVTNTKQTTQFVTNTKPTTQKQTPNQQFTATGLRITSCTTSPGQGMSPVIQVLNSKG
ncbi:hypothetical protein Btru_034829 [Bulinus truncatus]|nr:hypothetical protein Btru_034829 [Bulinus truncatus]